MLYGLFDISIVLNRGKFKRSYRSIHCLLMVHTHQSHLFLALSSFSHSSCMTRCRFVEYMHIAQDWRCANTIPFVSVKFSVFVFSKCK